MCCLLDLQNEQLLNEVRLCNPSTTTFLFTGTPVEFSSS